MTDTSFLGPLPLSTLPEILPVLPLNGGVLLPHARLSLNVTEEHHVALIEDALGQGRLIGIIQPTPTSLQQEKPDLYQVGAAGRIVSFAEAEEGGFFISLQGVCRFRVMEELLPKHGYRRVHPAWRPFLCDLAMETEGMFDRAKLLKVLHGYFKTSGIETDWNVIQEARDGMLVDSLAMLCPLKPSEKQALLEVVDLAARAEMLIALLEMDSMPQVETEGLKN